MGAKIVLNKIWEGIETRVLRSELYVNFLFTKYLNKNMFYVVPRKPVTIIG